MRGIRKWQADKMRRIGNENRKKKRNKKVHIASRVAVFGMLTALAMILSYVETLIPISLGIPGVKPGLANLAVFTALYMTTPANAFGISMVRILLTAFTFGNLYSMLYSLAGGILSFLLMLLCKKKDWLNKTGVSIVGGVSHNLGQLAVAAAVVENTAVFAYFPMLLLAGTAAGTLIGLLGALILARLPKNLFFTS